ncbi:MAG: hypothetical protein WB676_27705 [Bryobacteraceae bacterium]
MTNPLGLIIDCLIGTIILGGSLSLGTSLALIRTDEGIAIATDSRAVDEYGNKRPDACKIIEVGKDLYYSLAGMTQGNGFNIRTTIERRIKVSDVRRGTLSVKEALTHVFATRLNDPQVVDFDKQNRSIVTVLLFGMDGTVPTVGFVKLSLRSGLLSTETHVCPSDCIDGRKAYSTTPSMDFDLLSRTAPPLDAVRRFVRMEISKDIPDIGGPIQILTISRDGQRTWIAKPAICKDQD